MRPPRWPSSRVRVRACVAVLAVVSAACGTPPPEERPPPLPVVRERTPEVAAAVAATDAFGFDLLTAPGLAGVTNLVVSPFTASTALRLAGVGAAGETAAQVARVLHLPDLRAPHLPPMDQGDLVVTNTAWTQSGLTLDPLYQAALRNSYDTTHRETDFREDPEAARRTVNAAVADLVPPGSIDRRTRLVLASTLHLDVTWAPAFPIGATVDAPFTRADGTVVRVPVMHNDARFALGHAQGAGYQAVTLPCRGGALAFTVIVPETVEAVRAAGGVTAVLAAIRPAPVALTLPRFTATSSVDLRPPLEAAGMTNAFSPATADFSGVTTAEPFFLAAAWQRTSVRVTERGAPPRTPPTASPTPHAVTVDRPFLFVVTDTTTGTPLLLGRIGDPTSP